ncbi:hypothetical protein PV326_013436, partial [Microctonus aethiopoides]
IRQLPEVEAANVVVRKLEERKRFLQNSLATVEKELALRQQTMGICRYGNQ